MFIFLQITATHLCMIDATEGICDFYSYIIIFVEVFLILCWQSTVLHLQSLYLHAGRETELCSLRTHFTAWSNHSYLELFTCYQIKQEDICRTSLNEDTEIQLHPLSEAVLNTNTGTIISLLPLSVKWQ